MSRRSGVVRVRGVDFAVVALAFAQCRPRLAPPEFEADKVGTEEIREPILVGSEPERAPEPATEGERGVRVRGRLLDVEGMPYARRSVRVRVSSDSGCMRSVGEVKCGTDDGGRLDVVVAEFESAANKLIDLLVESERDVLIGRVRSEGGCEAGFVLDLGDRIVVPSEPWCAGVVVDGAGLPVAGANLGVFSNTCEQAFFTSDAAGRFEIRGIGTCVANSMRIWTTSVGGMATDDATFRPGDSDLRVVARPRGVLEGRIACDSFVAHEQLLVDVRSGEAGTQVQPAADGSFRVPSLVPGRYDVVLSFLGGAREELARFEGVEVSGATVVRDPRLANVDLRGRLRRVDLRVRDTAGRPLHGAVFVGGGVGVGRRLADVRDGAAVIAVGHPTLIEVWSAGHRPARVTPSGDFVDVTLDDGLPVRVRIVPWEPSHGLWSAQLRLVSSAEAREASVLAPYTGGSGASLCVPQAGTYEFELYTPLSLEGGVDANGNFEHPVAMTNGTCRVGIADDPQEQYFEIALDPEAVRAMVAKAEETWAEWRGWHDEH